jgi:hypothetical protein
MNKRLLSLFTFGLLAGGLIMAPACAQDASYRIIGYYTSWSIYDRAYFVTDIPVDKLTL